MAVTTTPKLGLNKPDDGEADWGQLWRDSMDNLEARVATSGTAEPNGDAIPVDYIGQKYIQTGTANELWIGTTIGIPPAGVWSSVSKFSNAVNFLSDLTVQGTTILEDTLTANAQILANGGVVIDAGQTLEGPQGQKWLSALGAGVMDPFLHADRHKPGGADPIPFPGGLLLDTEYKTTGLVTISTVEPSRVDILTSKTYNFANRSFNTRMLLIYGGFIEDVDDGVEGIWTVRRESVTQPGVNLDLRTKSYTQIMDGLNSMLYREFLLLFQEPPIDDLVYTFQGSKDSAGTDPTIRQNFLLILDFGDAI